LIQCISPDQSDGIAKQAADFITIKKPTLGDSWQYHFNSLDFPWWFQPPKTNIKINQSHHPKYPK